MAVKQSLLRGLPVFAYAPALLLPFATLAIFQSGVSERAEPIILGAHAFAALAALMLALRAATGSLDGTALRPAWPALALALWSFAIALGRGTPLVGLYGVPQSGLGVLWYLDLAVWLILAGVIVRHADQWRHLTLFCAAVHWGAALLTLWAKFTISSGPSSDLPLLFITTAWPAYALPVMLLAHPGGPAWRWRIAIVLGASLVSLVAAGSLTFALIEGMAAVACAIAWRWGDRLAWLRSRWFGLAVAAIAVLLPFIFVATGVAAHLGASMRARVLVMQVVLTRLQEQWDIWLFGLGWGRTGETFALHLNATDAALWDIGGWDFLFRDYFHSHNLVTEAVLAAGLPGLLLAIAIPAIPIWLAPAEKRAYATIFAAGWLVTLGVWFELIFVLPVFAMAAVALCHREATVDTILSTRLRYSATVICVAMAGLLGVAASLLSAQMTRVDAMRGWLAAPQGAPPPLRDIRNDDGILAAIANGALQAVKRRAEAGPLVIETENRRLAWMIAAFKAAIPQTQNPALPIVGANLLNDLALNPLLSPVRAAHADALALWPQWLDRALTLAPARSDVALGYLTWRFNAGDHRETLLWARRLRAHNADDPAGLYFEGGVYAIQPDPQARQRGLALLRRALDQGIERYIPLDESFKAAVRSAP